MRDLMADEVRAFASSDYPTACPTCGNFPHYLATFPGGFCLPCYALSQESVPMPTAAEIVSMWGGPVHMPITSKGSHHAHR